MSTYDTAVAGNDEFRRTQRRRPPLMEDLFDMTGGDLRLMMIYKKIEIAAETGDWSLMNELYSEFKMTQAAMN